jgi:uncharacterized membrane protein YjgN (DUF898 family)
METIVTLGLGQPPVSHELASTAGAVCKPIQFQFKGSVDEYFRLWIVNTLLSVMTLGVYSAWAKVTRLQYFYGNTFLDGVSFAYHGAPLAILKGRVLTYGVLAIVAILNYLSPALGKLLTIGLGFAAPVLIVRALRFRNANSSYRGIRFDFDGLQNDAYGAYVWGPAGIPLTLGLLYPYVVATQRKFVADGTRYGSSQFALTASTRSYYVAYARAGALLVGLLVMAYGLAVIAQIGLDALGLSDPATEELSVADYVAATGFLIALGASIVSAYAYVSATVTNLVWNNLSLGEHRFSSTQRPVEVAMIFLTNLAAAALTLGLALPWARIRLARYRADHLQVLPAFALDEFVASESHVVKATAGEFADALGLDIGL